MFLRNKNTGTRVQGPGTSKKILYIIIILSLSFSSIYPLSYAAENKIPAELPSKEPIVVNGDKVEYFQEQKEVVGTGNISIFYRDVVLTCDRIQVYLDTREAIAEGNVKITQKGAYFTGERINYNFDTRKGTVLKGYLNARPFYGKADEVDKIANKDQFNLDRGYITTCDLQKPHYRLQARQIKIYLNDKVVAKHIIFFIQDTPVFYWPYYVQPLQDRKSHVTIIPGKSSDWGYYVLSSYRLTLDDNSRADLLLDYRHKKGLAEGVNYYYRLRELGEGAFKVYYTKENDTLAWTRTGEQDTRYRYQWRHKWQVTDDTLGIVEFNKLKDRNVIKDYFYNEYEEIGDNPDNYISFITQKTDYSTELLFRKSFNNFLNVVERLPEYSINIPNFRLTKNMPFYYSANASAVYLNKTFDRTTTPWEVQKDLSAARIDVYNQLSYVTRLFRSLNVTPFVGTEDTYYSRNKWGDPNVVRTVFKAGVDNSIKFYKVYDINTDFLGLDINKLRHIITPTVSYFYTHQPTISPDNLNQFDEIDSVDTQNGFALALENRIQTKRKDGDQMKSVDLATLIISTNYLFRLERNNWNIKDDSLDKINFQLELLPYSWAYLVTRMTVNPKKNLVETLETDVVASGGDNWSVSLGHRYEETATDKTNLVTLDAMYKINDKWRIRAYERVDTRKRYVQEQEYTLYRDLHCWMAEFTYDIQDPGDKTFWVVLKLKAFPEYPIGLQRTYSRPRFGSESDQPHQFTY